MIQVMRVNLNARPYDLDLLRDRARRSNISLSRLVSRLVTDVPDHVLERDARLQRATIRLSDEAARKLEKTDGVKASTAVRQAIEHALRPLGSTSAVGLQQDLNQ